MMIAEPFRGEGREIGRQEGKKQIIEAIKALQEGTDIKEVAKITGLSLEEIEELKKQLN